MQKELKKSYMKDPEENDQDYYTYIQNNDMNYFHMYFVNIQSTNDNLMKYSFYLKFIKDIGLNCNVKVQEDQLLKFIQEMSYSIKMNLLIEI